MISAREWRWGSLYARSWRSAQREGQKLLTAGCEHVGQTEHVVRAVRHVRPDLTASDALIAVETVGTVGPNLDTIQLRS